VLTDLLKQDRRHFVIGGDIDPDIRADIGDTGIKVNYFGLFSRSILINESIDDLLIIKNIIAGNFVEHLYELSLPNFASAFIRCIDYSIRKGDMEPLYRKLFWIFVEHDNLHGISQLTDMIFDPEELERNVEYVTDVFVMAHHKATPEALNIIGTKLLEKNPLAQISQTRAYNMGNFLGTIGKHTLAIKYFIAAFRGEGGRYIKSGYSFREFAGSLFQLGRYHCASAFYRKAISLQRNVDWYGLLGDALFFNCQLDEARQAFSLCIQATRFVGAEPHPEWELKKALSDFLYTKFSDGNVASHTSDKITSSEFLISALDLRPPAAAELWFNRAVFFEERDPQSAGLYMALAACLDHQNIGLWVDAFGFTWNWGLSLTAESERTYFQYFLSVLYITARYWIGRPLDALLLDQIEAKKREPRYQSAMKNAVAALAEEADRRLKLIRKERGYYTVRLYPPGERD
jgi:tetratricopeptide (TPR) repeat protein